MTETAAKYEDAVRVHAIMYKALDEERNVQAGTVYELAQEFRSQIREIDPYMDDLIAQNHAFRSLAAGLGPVLRAAAEADMCIKEKVDALEKLLGEEGFASEEEGASPEGKVPSPLPAPPAQITLDI